MSGTMTISHDPVDNALNPAWRKSVVHLITSTSWPDSLPQANVSQIVNDVTYNKLNALRRLEPNTGAYLNEVRCQQFLLLPSCLIISSGPLILLSFRNHRPTLSNRDGSGRSSDPIMGVFAPSKRITILRGSSGALSA